jgi:hypothetical protein
MAKICHNADRKTLAIAVIIGVRAAGDCGSEIPVAVVKSGGRKL